jgi:hypothetical protein
MATGGGSGVNPAPGANCQAIHDSYVATGADGRTYATWHPPSVGACHFGHEHGDDPNGALALRGRPVLFGYATGQLGITEPHPGFKVFRWDNVSHPNAPSHTGASVVMTLHQGSSGAARFTTVHHDASFHYVNPRDGREVHVQMVAPFGTLAVGCGPNDPTMVLHQQQQAVPGMRQVSADKCFNTPSIPYEDWVTALYVGTDPRGNWMAYMDPHFAIFQPNTYCVVVAGSCQLSYSDVRAGTGTSTTAVSTNSRFKGTKREAYLNQVWVENSSGSTTVWTDAYGKLVTPNSSGAIAQYISIGSKQPLGDSAAFGDSNVHDDGTVKAPN